VVLTKQSCASSLQRWRVLSKAEISLVLNEMKNPGLLNLWRLYQANIKTSISMENFVFRSHERTGLVEKGFIGPECVFFGQASFSHMEVMRTDFLFFFSFQMAVIRCLMTVAILWSICCNFILVEK